MFGGEDMDYRNFDENFTLEGKTAIVTGGASGIGYEIAKMYARKGANVVCFDLHAPEGLEAYMKEQGVGFAAYAGDITRSEDIDGCIQKTLEQFGRLDILVNCAGIGVVEGVLEHDEALWDKTLSINLTGNVRFMRAAARQIDKKLLQYQSKYVSVYTTRDWLALIALQLSADNLRMEEKQDTSPFEEKIREFTDELNRYLKDK